MLLLDAMILPQQIHNAYIIQEDQNHSMKNSLNKGKTMDLQYHDSN